MDIIRLYTCSIKVHLLFIWYIHNRLLYIDILYFKSFMFVALYGGRNVISSYNNTTYRPYNNTPD